MKPVKFLSLILFGALALFLALPGAANAQPPVLTTEVEDLPKEALPLKIVYNYEGGNVEGELDSNGVQQADLRDLGKLKGVTLGETFIPADGKTKDVEVAVEVPGEDKLWIRIRLSVTVWEDRAGNVYVHVRLSVTIRW